MKDFSKLTNEEKLAFADKYNFGSLNHAGLLYEWFRSILDKQFWNMEECGEGVGELESACWLLQFKVDLEDVRTIHPRDYNEEPYAEGTLYIDGTLNIYDADKEITYVFEFSENEEA